MDLVSSVLILAVFIFGVWVLRNLNSWYYAVKLRKIWPHLPPGDLGWPLLGSSLFFLKNFSSLYPEKFLNKFTLRYGKLGMYKTHIWGYPSIIVRTPELIRQVLTDEERFVPNYPKTIRLLTGRRSLMAVSKSEHRRLRRLTTVPVAGHVALEMYIEDIERTVTGGLEEWASMRRPIELLTEIKGLTFRVIWSIFMGSTNSLGSSIAIDLEKMKSYLGDIGVGFGSIPVDFPGFFFRKALKSRKELLKMLQAILEEKKTVKKSKGKNSEAKDMMDMLMEAEDEDGQRIDDETIVDLIMGKLIAGHETSAYTAMWAVMFLVDHPHCFTKAKEEQEDIIKRRPSTQKGISLVEIKQMKYLSQVIDETLRVAGITSMVFRETNVDVEINGKTIPKGWRVLPMLGLVYKDTNLYDSPQEFNPSRWDNFKPKLGAFIPFGLGNRTCPGMDLAKLEISIFLHYFVLNYTVKRLNPNCKIITLPLPHPKDKCLATVHKVA